MQICSARSRMTIFLQQAPAARWGDFYDRVIRELVAILFVASSVTLGFAQNKRTDLASNQPGVAPSTNDWRAS